MKNGVNQRTCHSNCIWSERWHHIAVKCHVWIKWITLQKFKVKGSREGYGLYDWWKKKKHFKNRPASLSGTKTSADQSEKQITNWNLLRHEEERVWNHFTFEWWLLVFAKQSVISHLNLLWSETLDEFANLQCFQLVGFLFTQTKVQVGQVCVISNHMRMSWLHIGPTFLPLRTKRKKKKI